MAEARAGRVIRPPMASTGPAFVRWPSHSPVVVDRVIPDDVSRHRAAAGRRGLRSRVGPADGIIPRRAGRRALRPWPARVREVSGSVAAVRLDRHSGTAPHVMNCADAVACLAAPGRSSSSMNSAAAWAGWINCANCRSPRSSSTPRWCRADARRVRLQGLERSPRIGMSGPLTCPQPTSCPGRSLCSRVATPSPKPEMRRVGSRAVPLAQRRGTSSTISA
jgi:hypothetical protein